LNYIPAPQISGARVIRALEKAGFIQKRQSGSHVVMRHSFDLNRRCVIPVHGSAPIKPGTLRAILKGCGISTEEFKKFL